GEKQPRVAEGAPRAGTARGRVRSGEGGSVWGARTLPRRRGEWPRELRAAAAAPRRGLLYPLDRDDGHRIVARGARVRDPVAGLRETYELVERAVLLGLDVRAED